MKTCSSTAVQLVPTDPIRLPLCLSCLSSVHLVKSSDRMGLGDMCAEVEAKGPQRVPLAGALWRITINSADNNPLDFEDKYSRIHTHTHARRQAPLGEGEGTVQGGLNTEGHFKRARFCPRDAGVRGWM